MKKFKTIYFIYDADGGLWNEVKYWYQKNISKYKNNTRIQTCIKKKHGIHQIHIKKRVNNQNVS